MELWTDLHLVWKVVEDNHLQQQLLSADNTGGEVQGQEEVLQDRELQKNQVEASQQAKWSPPSLQQRSIPPQAPPRSPGPDSQTPRRR